MSKRLIKKIEELKLKRKAVILSHNYQSGEIQDIADFCGDSLGLSIKAAETEADVIVFCGVLFMAETAKILSPEKTVLLPDKDAGCPMADMITADGVIELKKKHRGALVVCYVNSSAEVKAESDYCCTSSNAVAVVESLPLDREVIFVPDCHLGHYAAEQSGRELILWPGYCWVHQIIRAEDVEEAKSKYPDAVVLTHPECDESVKAISDEILSTGGMLKLVAKSGAKQFIVATETGIIHSMKKSNPAGEYISACEKAVCSNMKKITLEKILWSLEDMEYKIELPIEICDKAKRSLSRMVAIGPIK